MQVGVSVEEERTVGDVTQEEQPHGGEQQGTCEHEEAGVAEGELEPNAQPRRSSHGLLRHAPCPDALSSRRSAAVSMRIGMPLPEATMRPAISSPEGPGMSRSRTAMS